MQTLAAVVSRHYWYMTGPRVRSSLGLAVILILLAAATWLFSSYLRSKGMAWAGNFGSLASAVLGAAALLTPIVSRLLGELRGPPPVSRIDIPQARADLVAALARQWAEEERLQRINDPRPLPVQWAACPAEAALAQDAPVPPNGLAGQFDDIAPLFGRLLSHRLVILGDAGAGKSVLVTRLARDLLADHDATTLVPIIVPAAAWDPGTDLPDWIAGQLLRSHPGLARRVRDATGKVVTLAYALATDKVLPIIDGLDEMPYAERARAIIQINDFGSDIPLVLTSRPPEYLNAVAAVGRGISRADVIKVKPLPTSQVSAYLTEATAANPPGRWQRVIERLDAGPDEPLARVLSTPLMLWLARTAYDYSESEPAELLDRTRFPDAQALERYLLEAFVPAVYGRRRPGVRPTERQAERWLGWLASYLDATGQRGFAWWRLSPAVRGWRVAAMTVRAVLGITAGWVIVDQVLVRHGYWRDDHYHRRGSLHAILLGGPLGHLIRPAADHVFTVVRDPLNTYWNEFLRSGQPFNYFLPWHSLAAFMWAMAALGILGGIAVAFDKTEPAGPSTLRIRVLPALRASVVGLFKQAVYTGVVIAGLLGLAILHKKGVTTGSFLRTHTTWEALGIISLFGLNAVPASLRIPLDVSGSLSPAKALRLSQQADAIGRISRRLIVAAVVWLWAGPQIVVAYGIYAALETVLVGSVLGGAIGAAPVYADARNCLFATRRMPWRMMPFLADAHRRGVLRQVGAVYEFRHIRLQEQLAAKHPWWATRALDLAERELHIHLPRIAVALSDTFRIIVDDEWARQHGLQITVRGGGRLHLYRDPRLDRATDASGSNGDKEQQPEAHIGTGRPNNDAEAAVRPYLMPSERSVIAVRMHPVLLLGSLSFLIAGLVAAVALTALVSGIALTVVWIGWICGLLVFMLKIAQWYESFLAITEQRIITISGLFTRKEASISLSEVTDLTLQRSISARLFGYGIIRIMRESAGRNQPMREMRYVPHSGQFYLEAVSLLLRLRKPASHA